MDVGLLGPVRAWVEGRPVGLGRPGDRAVLAVLALAAPRTVSITELIDSLWADDPPASAGKVLQNHVLRLRKAATAAGSLDPVILTDGRGYRFAGSTFDVDVHRAAQGARQARYAAARGEHRFAAGLWAEVLAQWRGDPLADVRDLPFAVVARAELIEQRWTAIEERFAAELEAGGEHRIVPELRAATAAAPLRERLWVQLMQALSRVGRQAEALAAFGDLRRVLRDEVGLDPSAEAVAVHRSIAAGTAEAHPPPLRATVAPAARPGRPIPVPRARFIGRQRDIVEVTGLLATRGCVCIVGAGGVGKTRLAVQVARDREADYPDGVVFVELAAVARGEPVIDTLAAAIGVTEQGSRASLIDLVAAHFGRARALLVLDNCEHVIDSAAEVAKTLLEACPHLGLIATSREPLRIYGEAVWRLSPLPVPDRDQPATPLAVDSAAASRLLLDRARLARPELALDEETAPLLAEIARALDGLPLALELAAAALTVFDLPTLAASLNDRFGVLVSDRRFVPERQRTLRATIDWSYQLLDPADRTLLLRLSVFAGSATAPAITAVAGPDDVGPGLRRLVDRSLVDTVTGPRYRLLDMVREYAHKLLLDGSADAQAYEPLISWACETVHDAAHRIRTTADRSALRVFEDDYANLIGALGHALDVRDVAAASALAIDLAAYWAVRGLFSEGRHWVGRVLELDRASSPVDAARSAWLHFTLCDLTPMTDSETSLAEIEDALALARDAGNPALISRCLSQLGFVLAAPPGRRFEAAAAVYLEAADQARLAGDTGAEATALSRLSTVRSYQHRPDEAVALLSAANKLFAIKPDQVESLWIRGGMATEHFLARDLDAAENEIVALLADARKIHYALGEEWALILSAQIALSRGDLDAVDRRLTTASIIATELRDDRQLAWIGRLRARLLVARGDARAAAMLLASLPLPAERSGIVLIARQVVVLLTAVDRLEQAAGLLESIREPPDAPLRDPLLSDDLAWCRRRFQEAHVLAPATRRDADLGELTVAALSDLAAVTDVITLVPPIRPDD